MQSRNGLGNDYHPSRGTKPRVSRWPMRAWTIQTLDAHEVLQDGRTWRARGSRVPSQWRDAYVWMTRQMHSRLGPPARQGQAPIWAWREWRGRSRARPDLRARGHLPPGTDGVRLELEVEEDRLLPSDFELWHYVLNGWYLPASHGDERSFEALATDAARDEVRGRIEASWQRIFDIARIDRRYTAPPAERSIQCVLWEIRPRDVRRVTEFTAR